MDKLEEYRNIIQNILETHSAIPIAHGDIKSSVFVDQARNNFILMVIGWNHKKRVHGFIVHVEIIGDKIWVQRDGIEDGITKELEAAGIPKNKIVLGFHPPYVRPNTGYAIA